MRTQWARMSENQKMSLEKGIRLEIRRLGTLDPKATHVVRADKERKLPVAAVEHLIRYGTLVFLDRL